MIFAAVFAAYIAGSAAQAPFNATKFDWSGAGDYSINGTFCSTQTIVGFPIPPNPVTCQPVAIAINPSSNRAALFLGGGGIFWHLSNITYVTGVISGKCGVNNVYTYNTFVNDYSNAFSIDKNKDDKFSGIVAGTCGTDVSTFFDINNKGNVLQWVFGQRFPSFIPNTNIPICLRVWGNIDFDRSTLVKGAAHLTPYFNLPATCLTPADQVDYCSTAYFSPGNACF